MESHRWKAILFEWVRKTGLVEINGTFDQINLNTFFKNSIVKLQKSDPNLSDDLKTFLAEHFPDYDVLVDESSNISSQDFMYIFSLILFYSCVLRINEFFQQACQSLSEEYQPFVFKFFSSLKQAQEDKTHITKEFLRNAIKEAFLFSPHPKFISSSPIKNDTPILETPPSHTLLSEKSKELQKTRIMLEDERYERYILESDIKQSEHRIEGLLRDQKLLKQELHAMQMLHMEETSSNDNDASTSSIKLYRDEHMREKMRREIESREDTIFTLRCDLDFLKVTNGQTNNRLKIMERELKDYRTKYNELAIIAEEFKTIIEQRNVEIVNLQEANTELNLILSEMPKPESKKKETIAMEFYDFPLPTPNFCDNSSSSEENLGKSVIDIQLKEKWAENDELKEILNTVSSEKEELLSTLSIQEQRIEALEEELKAKSREWQETFNESHSDKMKIQAEEIKELNSFIAERNMKIDKMLTEIKIYKDSLASASQYAEMLTEQEKQISSLKNKIREKDSLNEKLCHAINELTAEFNAVKDEKKHAMTANEKYILDTAERHFNRFKKIQEDEKLFSIDENITVMEKVKRIEERFPAPQSNNRRLSTFKRTRLDSSTNHDEFMSL